MSRSDHPEDQLGDAIDMLRGWSSVLALAPDALAAIGASKAGPSAMYNALPDVLERLEYVAKSMGSADAEDPVSVVEDES